MRLIGTIIFASLTAGSALAQQSPTIARTPDGHPDLQGVWATEFITRLERPKEANTLNATPDEAKQIAEAILARSAKNSVTDPDNAYYAYDQLASVGGTFRTSLIIDPADGKIPYSKTGRELADRFDTRETYAFDNPEERPPYERCLSGLLAPPIRNLTMLIPLQIVQTPGHVVLRNEDVQGVRIIPFGDPSRAAIPQFDGRPSAHWDGETLVIETTDFRRDDVARPDMGPPIMLNPSTRVAERFTRTSHDVLLYQYTVEDPQLYTAPWRAEFEFRLLDPGVVYEYACHEGNLSMVSMLTAGRLNQQSKPPAN